MTSERQSGLWQHYLHCDSIKIFRIITEARKEMEPFLKACLNPLIKQCIRG